MIVVRRTFYCKPGHAGPASQLCKEIVHLSKEVGGMEGRQRVYTDLSGKTDQVVLESEWDSFVHPREMSARVHGHPDAPRIFGELGLHLEGAETDFYTLELSEEGAGRDN
ncbi:MAG: hypothetical protein M3Z66_17355 [Chloroflexota bacterium]|nr:hypothetical protein [Chloroflexota bacterium]